MRVDWDYEKYYTGISVVSDDFVEVKGKILQETLPFIIIVYFDHILFLFSRCLLKYNLI